MAASMTKGEYLKRYLSSSSKKKIKKGKKEIPPVAKATTNKSKIVDDDIDLKALASLDSDNDIETGEDAPLIVGIVDERPTEVQKMEIFTKSNKWRVFGADDSSNSPVLERTKIAEDRTKIGTNSPKHGDDPESDQSPPRPSPGRHRHDSDSDVSSRRHRHDSDSDHSPQRRRQHDDSTLMRSLKQKEQRVSDLDAPHVKRKDTHELGFGKIVEKASAESDSDQSPPRARRDSDSDQSPSRKKSRESTQLHEGRSHSKARQNNRSNTVDHSRIATSKNTASSDSDHSPPRRTKLQIPHDFDPNQSLRREHRNSKQALTSRRSSPERRSPRRSPKRPEKHRVPDNSAIVGRERSDLDLSPPRKTGKMEPPKLLEKTLDGKKAGLLDSKTLKLENEAVRKREKLLLEKMGDELSGRNAKTVLRDRDTGHRRDLEEERRQKMEEDAIKAERDAKYHEWGRGLKQKDMQKSRLENDLHEMSKPLARYKDDVDLDKELREQERAGDPMLAFIKKKKAAQSGGKELPKYTGPQPPPNRYNIWPGYRWDGVDRSCGYEKTRFARLSSKVAAEEEAYKWSTEDM